jgi:hypothetical protein
MAMRCGFVTVDDLEGVGFFALMRAVPCTALLPAATPVVGLVCEGVAKAVPENEAPKMTTAMTKFDRIGKSFG